MQWQIQGPKEHPFCAKSQGFIQGVGNWDPPSPKIFYREIKSEVYNNFWGGIRASLIHKINSFPSQAEKILYETLKVFQRKVIKKKTRWDPPM